MSVSDIRIPSSTLAELRGVLVRALSRENLSVTDKIAIRKSQSSSALKIHYTAHYGGKAVSHSFHYVFLFEYKKRLLTAQVEIIFFGCNFRVLCFLSVYSRDSVYSNVKKD